ncbi:MAG: CCA tRNA nucleotidyltransferase [Clostridia bacterium]|nr:CCA tRNA nucleotidyltransferase [Clostridia bacterium]
MKSQIEVVILFDESVKAELEELASYFPIDMPLYAVGGCVRDYLRGKECYDVDLSGGVRPNDLVELLSKSPFRVVSASPRLGTVIIKGKNTYEYTTFRIDSYPAGSGIHTPTDVQFTDDLTVDAKRRDFKCNAIYYDIKGRQIIDPLGGIEDIKQNILSTTIDPDVVLSQDGLRILRLARFVSKLGYEIEKQTYYSAKRLVSRLNEISVERIREELNKIMEGEHCYKALCIMRDMGILSIILPELAQNDGVKQKVEYHKYDVLEHTFKVVEACPPQVRLAGLFHDIAKGVCQEKDGNTYLHNILGAQMTGDIMTRLKYPNREIERVSRMVELHMFDINGNTKESKCRRFIANNLDIFHDMLALFNADSIGTGYYESSMTADKLRKIYAKMLEEKVPMSIKELAVDGNDLKSLGYGGREIGQTLNALWDMALRNCIANRKDALLDVAKRRIKKV